MSLRWLALLFGVLLWLRVVWDLFATVVLPRTIAPKWRLSGIFTNATWRIWAAAARRMRTAGFRLGFLSIYGPLSVIALLVLWAGLIIISFALIYHGLGPRIHVTAGDVNFRTLLYMSGSTFLTLGLGDVTSPDGVARFFIVLEAGCGYIFLGLIITYMPLLDQAYGAREVGSELIHSRAGHPAGALSFLRRYRDPEHSEILRANLREGERWMAEILQSHLSHPVLAYYRAQHLDRSWLISFMAILDTSTLLIVGGHGRPAEQARLTYRMGVTVLKRLTSALGVAVDGKQSRRLGESDLPAFVAGAEAAGLGLSLGRDSAHEVMRLLRLYDSHLVALADWLVILLPEMVPLKSPGRVDTLDDPEDWLEVQG
jgi:hypothetical protein